MFKKRTISTTPRKYRVHANKSTVPDNIQSLNLQSPQKRQQKTLEDLQDSDEANLNESDESYDAALVMSPDKDGHGQKIGNLQHSKEFKTPMNIPG